MTAPDRTTWTVAEDANGDQCLWCGDIAVLRHVDLYAPAKHADTVWQVLTRVLAPDEATVERLAQESHNAVIGLLPYSWDSLHEGSRYIGREHIRAVLAALAGTSAQARHTADDTKDDCPSYSEMTGGGES